MHPTRILPLAALLLFVTGLLALAPSAEAGQLTFFFEQAQANVFDQIDDFAIDSCDPPCEGLICCDNHVCVHTVLACGFYPIQIDSFRAHGSPRAQMAGFATQGVLAAEIGREARLWFGYLDGQDWSRQGVAPGYYELVLQEGAVNERAEVLVVGKDGREVARLGGHFWVFSSATSSAESSLDWSLGDEGIGFMACHAGECVQLSLDF